VAGTFKSWIIEIQGEDIRFWGDAFEASCESHDLIEAAVHKGKLFWFCQCALGGDRLTGSTARTKDECVGFSEIQAECARNSLHDARTIRIVSTASVFAKYDRVYRSEDTRFFCYFITVVQSLELVGHGNVATYETEFPHFLEGLGQTSRFDLQADVGTPDSKGIECGLMELRGGGMGDGVAENREFCGKIGVGCLFERCYGINGIHRWKCVR
jgi:hypothetical protein